MIFSLINLLLLPTINVFAKVSIAALDVAGDLSQRIFLENKNGFLERWSRGINDLANVFD